MSHIYAFREDADSGLIKFGGTKQTWRDRLAKQQPYNPRKLVMIGAWSIESIVPYRDIERAFRSQYPAAVNTPKAAEWYQTSEADVFAFMDKLGSDDDCARKLGFSGRVGMKKLLMPKTRMLAANEYKDTLNEGTRVVGEANEKFVLFLYLLGEENDKSFCRICTTAYSMATVRNHCWTANHRGMVMLERWRATSNAHLRRAKDQLLLRFSSHHLHFGWLTSSPEEIITAADQVNLDLHKMPYSISQDSILYSNKTRDGGRVLV